MQKKIWSIVSLVLILTNNFSVALAEEILPTRILNLKATDNFKARNIDSMEKREYQRLEQQFIQKKKKGGGKITSSSLIGRWSVNNQASGENFSLDILDIATEGFVSVFPYRIVDDGFIVSSGVGMGIGTVLVFNFTYVNGNETYFMQVNKARGNLTGQGAVTAYIPSECVDDSGDGNFAVGELYLCVLLNEPFIGFGTVSMIQNL